VREILDKIKFIKLELKVWTMRMLEALVNGVKGGKWFSLIDKVYRSETLNLTWEAVRRNAGLPELTKSVSANSKWMRTNTLPNLRMS
jgi:hypothetical protein